jgi:hypothetical protein
MNIRAFITHKLAENYSDCQDRFGVNEDTKSIAVSDGMGSTWQQKIWAQLLVDSFTGSSDWLPTKETIKPLCESWRNKVIDYIEQLKKRPRTGGIQQREIKLLDAQIYRNERGLALGYSAGATFVGIRFEKNLWNGSVLGDSCLIEWNGSEAKFNTSQDVEAFDSYPDYFDSDELKQGKGTPKVISGTLDKGNVNKKILAYANTSKTELLFLAQFVRSLEIGGRCASIVPDGVLFGTSKAHVAIRKEIVDNQQLRAVISMPSGVFKPYAGVSTAVLIFTKTNSGGTDKVWFYDMKADGFSLDDKRSAISENDIPDVVSRFHNLEAEESRSRKEQSFFVPLEEIRQNDYDLSINKYKEVEREIIEYEPVEDILQRIDETEGFFLKGYKELCNMLEVKK